MTSITTSDAADFSVSDIPERYYLDQRPTSQLFRLLPFIPIEGHKMVLNGVDAEGGTLPGLADAADAESAGAAISASMQTPNTATFEIKRLAAELQVDGIITGLYGSHNDIRHELIRLKVEAVRDLFKALVYRGDEDTDPDEFYGLARMTSTTGPFTSINGGASQTMVANASSGGTVLVGEIEELLAMITPRGEPDRCYLVMHAEAFEHLQRTSYKELEYVQDPHLGTLPAIGGVAILIDNFIPIDETYDALTTTSIYAVVIGEHEGLCGIYPAVHEGDEIQVRGPYGKEAADRQYYHVTWDVGLACFNSGAVARLEGVEFAN